MYVFQVLTVKQSFRLLLRTDMEEPLFLIVNYLKFFSFRSFVLQVFMEKHQSREILKSSFSLGCWEDILWVFGRFIDEGSIINWVRRWLDDRLRSPQVRKAEYLTLGLQAQGRGAPWSLQYYNTQSRYAGCAHMVLSKDDRKDLNPDQEICGDNYLYLQ